MRTMSVSVSESDYQAFRTYAARHGCSIAELVREAMALYRKERLATTDRLERLPVSHRPRPIRPLPTREEIFDEMTERHGDA